MGIHLEHMIEIFMFDMSLILRFTFIVKTIVRNNYLQLVHFELLLEVLITIIAKTSNHLIVNDLNCHKQMFQKFKNGMNMH
jgi:hypothetical protein